MLPPHPFFHLAMVAPDLFDVLLKLDFANLSLLLFKLFSDLRLLAQKGSRSLPRGAFLRKQAQRGPIE